MITVFHANRDITRESFNYGFGTSMESLIAYFHQGKYDNAGDVDTNDLNVAFAQSQNIESAWGDGKQRSTSVGDIFYCDNGDAWLVAEEGFEQIRKGA